MADEKRKTQKVFLTNTGPGAFVVTDAEGAFIEIPGKPELQPVPPTAPLPSAPPPPLPEGQDPPWVKEVELDEGMLDVLKKRQEKGSPLHIGKESAKESEQQHAPQTAQEAAEHNKTSAHTAEHKTKR